MINWFLNLNGHLKIAIILAPLLGILSFGLTDLWVSKEQPKTTDQQPAVMHELQLSGKCMLDASCLLSQEELSVMLKSVPASDNSLLRIDIGASGHIRGLQLALVQNGQETKLVAQRTNKTDRWYVEFPRKLLTQPTFTLRLALAQTKQVYLAEFPAKF